MLEVPEQYYPEATLPHTPHAEEFSFAHTFHHSTGTCGFRKDFYPRMH